MENNDDNMITKYEREELDISIFQTTKLYSWIFLDSKIQTILVAFSNLVIGTFWNINSLTQHQKEIY